MARWRASRTGILLALAGAGLIGGSNVHPVADLGGNWTIVHKHWSMIEKSEAQHHGHGSLPVDEPDSTGQW